MHPAQPSSQRVPCCDQPCQAPSSQPQPVSQKMEKGLGFRPPGWDHTGEHSPTGSRARAPASPEGTSSGPGHLLRRRHPSPLPTECVVSLTPGGCSRTGTQQDHGQSSTAPASSTERTDSSLPSPQPHSARILLTEGLPLARNQISPCRCCLLHPPPAPESRSTVGAQGRTSLSLLTMSSPRAPLPWASLTFS